MRSFVNEPPERDDGRFRPRGGLDAVSHPSILDRFGGTCHRLRRSSGTGRAPCGEERGRIERARRATSIPSLSLAMALLTSPLVVGVATAHGGGPSTGEGHLVVDFIGLLAFAFLVYLAYVLAKGVLYPRLRDALLR